MTEEEEEEEEASLRQRLLGLVQKVLGLRGPPPAPEETPSEEPPAPSEWGQGTGWGRGGWGVFKVLGLCGPPQKEPLTPREGGQGVSPRG